MKFLGKKNAGFSLVELMVVVAIIGILAALAVPRFQTFQAKARQSEGKNNLSHIYTLQESYYGDNETYAPVPPIGAVLTSKVGCVNTNNAIGFKLMACTATENKVRYNYSTTSQQPAALATAFTAQATTGTGTGGVNNRVFPRCTTADLWRINEQKTLTDVNRAINGCQQ